MTKFEEIIIKYPEEIKENLASGSSFAWNRLSDKPCLCKDVSCIDCLFSEHCTITYKKEFLNTIVDDVEISENRNKDGEITW